MWFVLRVVFHSPKLRVDLLDWRLSPINVASSLCFIHELIIAIRQSEGSRKFMPCNYLVFKQIHDQYQRWYFSDTELKAFVHLAFHKSSMDACIAGEHQSLPLAALITTLEAVVAYDLQALHGKQSANSYLDLRLHMCLLCCIGLIACPSERSFLCSFSANQRCMSTNWNVLI